MEKTHNIKIYFYTSPYFLFMSDSNIIDLNLKVKRNKTKYIQIIFDDDFFEMNLRERGTKEWQITIQAFDQSGTFISQIDLYGENLRFGKSKKGKSINLEYEQITTNNGWPSIPKVFLQGEENFILAKKSYLRNKMIKNLLN